MPVYQRRSAADIEEEDLRQRLLRLEKRHAFCSEEMEELRQLEVRGYEMLVDVAVLFRDRIGQLPRNPPMSVLGRPHSELLDEHLDWTLAHEELFLARRLEHLKRSCHYTDTMRAKLALMRRELHVFAVRRVVLEVCVVR